MGSEQMKRIYFANHKQLSDYMLKRARDEQYVVAVLFYNDAKELLKELLKNDDVDVQALDIQPEMYKNYDREYYVSIFDMQVSIEPAYYDGEYFTTDAELTLIHSDACSAAIKDIPSSRCYEIYVGDLDESDPHEINDFLETLFDNARIVRDEHGNIISINFKYSL